MRDEGDELLIRSVWKGTEVQGQLLALPLQLIAVLFVLALWLIKGLVKLLWRLCFGFPARSKRQTDAHE